MSGQRDIFLCQSKMTYGYIRAKGHFHVSGQNDIFLCQGKMTYGCIRAKGHFPVSGQNDIMFLSGQKGIMVHQRKDFSEQNDLIAPCARKRGVILHQDKGIVLSCIRIK